MAKRYDDLDLATVEKLQRAARWAQKQARHQQDWQRKQAKRGVVVHINRGDEWSAWNGWTGGDAA